MASENRIDLKSTTEMLPGSDFNLRLFLLCQVLQMYLDFESVLWFLFKFQHPDI